MLPILCRHLHAWITLYFDSKFLKSLKEVRSGPTYWSGGGFELEDLIYQTNRFHETIKLAILKEDQQTFWMYGRRMKEEIKLKEIINHENAFVTCHTCRNRSTAACFFGRLSQSVVD